MSVEPIKVSMDGSDLDKTRDSVRSLREEVLNLGAAFARAGIEGAKQWNGPKGPTRDNPAPGTQWDSRSNRFRYTEGPNQGEYAPGMPDDGNTKLAAMGRMGAKIGSFAGNVGMMGVAGTLATQALGSKEYIDQGAGMETAARGAGQGMSALNGELEKFHDQIIKISSASGVLASEGTRFYEQMSHAGNTGNTALIGRNWQTVSSMNLSGIMGMDTAASMAAEGQRANSGALDIREQTQMVAATTAIGGPNATGQGDELAKSIQKLSEQMAEATGFRKDEYQSAFAGYGQMAFQMNQTGATSMSGARGMQMASSIGQNVQQGGFARAALLTQMQQDGTMPTNSADTMAMLMNMRQGADNLKGTRAVLQQIANAPTRADALARANASDQSITPNAVDDIRKAGAGAFTNSPENTQKFQDFLHGNGIDKLDPTAQGQAYVAMATGDTAALNKLKNTNPDGTPLKGENQDIKANMTALANDFVSQGKVMRQVLNVATDAMRDFSAGLSNVEQTMKLQTEAGAKTVVATMGIVTALGTIKEGMNILNGGTLKQEGSSDTVQGGNGGGGGGSIVSDTEHIVEGGVAVSAAKKFAGRFGAKGAQAAAGDAAAAAEPEIIDGMIAPAAEAGLATEATTGIFAGGLGATVAGAIVPVGVTLAAANLADKAADATVGHKALANTLEDSPSGWVEGRGKDLHNMVAGWFGAGSDNKQKTQGNKEKLSATMDGSSNGGAAPGHTMLTDEDMRLASATPRGAAGSLSYTSADTRTKDLHADNLILGSMDLSKNFTTPLTILITDPQQQTLAKHIADELQRAMFNSTPGITRGPVGAGGGSRGTTSFPATGTIIGGATPTGSQSQTATQIADWVKQYGTKQGWTPEEIQAMSLTETGVSNAESNLSDTTNSIGATGPFQMLGSLIPLADQMGGVHTVTGSLNALAATGQRVDRGKDAVMAHLQQHPGDYAGASMQLENIQEIPGEGPAAAALADGRYQQGINVAQGLQTAPPTLAAAPRTNTPVSTTPKRTVAEAKAAAAAGGYPYMPGDENIDDAYVGANGGPAPTGTAIGLPAIGAAPEHKTNSNQNVRVTGEVTIKMPDGTTAGVAALTSDMGGDTGPTKAYNYSR